MHPKKEMTRIVRTTDGSIEIDLTGKKSGRGTYICKMPQCLENALTTATLSKALNTTITQDALNRIKEDFRKI